MGVIFTISAFKSMIVILPVFLRIPPLTWQYVSCSCRLQWHGNNQEFYFGNFCPKKTMSICLHGWDLQTYINTRELVTVSIRIDPVVCLNGHTSTGEITRSNPFYLKSDTWIKVVESQKRNIDTWSFNSACCGQIDKWCSLRLDKVI